MYTSVIVEYTKLSCNGDALFVGYISYAYSYAYFYYLRLCLLYVLVLLAGE